MAYDHLTRVARKVWRRMIRSRYSAWDGSQAVWHPRPEEVLESLADSLLQDGDVHKALRTLLQHGMTDQRGRILLGLQDIVQRLRACRDQALRQYDPNSVVDDFRRQLDTLLARKRQALEAQLAVLRQRTDPAVAQMAARQAQMEAFPCDIGGLIQALQQYDFLDQQARADFAALQQTLHRQVLDHLLHAMLQPFHTMTPPDMQRLHQMIADLNGLLAQRSAGTEGDFQQFVTQHGALFPDGPPESLEELLEQLASHLHAMQSLLNSMTHEHRAALQQFMQQMGGDVSWQQALAALVQHIQSYMEEQGLGASLPFTGNTPLPLPEALQLIERLHDMARLEDHLERVLWGADPQQLDTLQVRALMGEEASGHVQALKELAEHLQNQGYICKSKDRLTLTARGIRRIAYKAMLDIFASMRHDQFGTHAARHRGIHGQRLEETKAYVYGEPLDLHLPRTLMNAVRRTAGRPPLRLAPQDFEVHSTEAVARCSTVLLLDMSGSMEREQRFTAAKKVALALDALIRTQFPRDALHMVGFFTYAEALHLEDLPYLTPKPFGFSPYTSSDMYHDPLGSLDLQIAMADAIAGRVDVPQAFTNIQAGLQMAGQWLMRQHAVNKQVILITDGEPTAHIRDHMICLEYPPSPRTVHATLQEVQRCTRHGITINTFMLGQEHTMERFVHALTKINRGRAFFTAPENIGDYILVDYLANRRRTIA